MKQRIEIRNARFPLISTFRLDEILYYGISNNEGYA